MLPRLAQLALLRRHLGHHTTGLTGRQWCPVPFHNPRAKLHRRHRPLACAAVQRAPRLHPPHRRGIAVRAVEHPMMSLSLNLHMGQVGIETLQCLTQHLALGLGKQLMGLTFKALKAFLRHRACPKGTDLLDQSLQRARSSVGAAGVMRARMKHWHRGSPPRWFLICTNHCRRGPLPRFLSSPCPLPHKVSPSTQSSNITPYNKSR